MHIFWEILLTGLGGFAAYLGRRVAQFLAIKINDSKHQALQHAVGILVSAVENEITEKGSGKAKFDHIFKRLQKKFPWASNVKLKEFIESAVFHLNKNIKKKENLK